MNIPVVGIDFGNLNTVIAVARNRGIDVICNEVSNRLTPSMVSFGPKARHLGEGAKTMEISNFKNTVSNFKRLIGRSFHDEEVHSIESKYINFDLVADEKGLISVRVQMQGEEKVFSMVQITAMFFSKCKEITEAALNTVVSDVVLSVPGYYTDQQRRALMDACEVAGMNPLRLVNELTASALGYGISKNDLPEDKPKHVVFVDIGQSNYSVAVVAYMKGKLEIKGTGYDRNLGGRDFDEVLVSHFIKEFGAKYKIDIASNKKALYRLRTSCERAKKMLSANSKTIVSVESIMEDKDVSAELSRQTFEELCAQILERLEAPVKQALSIAGLSIQEIDAIEMIGGSTRIPAIKEKLSAFFGKELSSHLNQDEAISRGCAFQAAILSPTFKVKEFSVCDQSPYPIKFSWETTTDAPDDKEIEIFNENNPCPSTKMLTFYRKEPFEIEATYSKPELVPFANSVYIGKFSIKNVVPKSNGKESTVKVKARLNPSGVVNIEQAHLIEDIEETIPEPPHTSEMPVENLETKVEEPKKKTIQKKIELSVLSCTASLPREIVAQFREQENLMASNDKLVADTEERKNALEEYIYDMRNKLDASLAEYATEETKEKLKVMLKEAEEWLYNEGWEATKSVYVSKLEALQKLGSPITYLHREAEDLEVAKKIFQDYVNKVQTSLQSTEEKYSHITTEERQKVTDEVEAKCNWLASKLSEQANRPKTLNPVLLSSTVREEADKILFGSNAILNKPKPKKEEPKKEEQAATNMDENVPSPTSETADEYTVVEPDMEVD